MVEISYPRHQLARSFKFLRHTSNIVLNSTTWANLPGLGTITLAAQVGDVIEAAFGGYHGGGAGGRLDCVTEVAGTPVTSFGSGGAAPTSTTGDGVGAWLMEGASDDAKPSGIAYLTLVSGDLSAGTVTLRMRGRVNSGTTTFSDGAIFFAAKNLGPMDPN